MGVLTETSPQYSEPYVDVQSVLYSVVSLVQVADRVSWRNKDLVQGDSWEWNSPGCKVDRGALLGVNFDSP